MESKMVLRINTGAQGYRSPAEENCDLSASVIAHSEILHACPTGWHTANQTLPASSGQYPTCINKHGK